MKQFATLLAAGSLLAAVALAQPARPGYTNTDRSAFDRNPLIYVLTNNPQTGAAAFGAVHLGSGSFVPIGPGLPSDLGHALAPTRGGSLLSMAFSGKLYSIDPRTGEGSVVGETGLGDCTTPASPCGPNSAVTLGRFDRAYYALDFSQNLYSLDPESGATKLIGPTGIPPITTVPGSIASDGELNTYEETLFSFRGKLYANFDTGQINLSTGAETPVIPAEIYEIDPATGHATAIAPTQVGLLTIVNANDTVYAFDAPNDRFLVLDPETGRTRVASNLDPAAGLVCGATPARPGPGR